VHLGVMDTTPDMNDTLEPVLTIAELAEQLCVSTQALYDLRCKGRGPHGFRVGRQIRFRRSEIEAWLVRLESEDQDRHAQHREDRTGTR
jgi:excisionase family DNA binding protein